MFSFFCHLLEIQIQPNGFNDFKNWPQTGGIVQRESAGEEFFFFYLVSTDFVNFRTRFKKGPFVVLLQQLSVSTEVKSQILC